MADDSFVVKVKHNKEKLEVSLTPSSTIGDIKRQVEEKTGIPVGAMKLTAAKLGLMSADAQSVSEAGITAKTLFMVTGTPAAEAEKAAKRPLVDLSGAVVEEEPESDTPFCERHEHNRILKTGPPEEPEYVGDKSLGQVPLPVEPGTRVPFLRGCIVNAKQQPLRLRLLSSEGAAVLSTESDQHRLPFGSIKQIKAYPITLEDGKWNAWSVLEIQLHASARSRVYVYWFPGQFVKNLQNIVFGF
eukprot:Hpha_TRINITY_DN15282_c4_g8::TRINITY_DN15282_c4_g8_i1::g.66703::m.66703